MIYEILDGSGGVVTRIKAPLEFMQANYTENQYREFVAPVAPPPVPQVVSRRQGKQALLLAGKLGDVQPAIDAITDPTEQMMAQIYWDDAQDFERNNATLISLATALGLTDAEVDELFIQAEGL